MNDDNFPDMNDTRWKTAQFSSVMKFTNIREHPVITGRINGKILQCETVKYIPELYHNGWYPVIKDNVEGWIYHEQITITPIQIVAKNNRQISVDIPLPNMLIDNETKSGLIKILEWIIVILKNYPEFSVAHNSVNSEDMNLSDIDKYDKYHKYQDSLNALITELRK